MVAIFFVQDKPVHKLENDPMCGRTTGGQEECTWDCEFDAAASISFLSSGINITNPECLRDCFEDVQKVQHSCINILLDNTACTGETEAALRDPDCIQSVFSKQPLIYSTLFNILIGKSDYIRAVIDWLCFLLVEYLNEYENVGTCRQIFRPYPQECNKNTTQNQERLIINSTQLSPIYESVDLSTGESIRTEVPFENTKHRYSWILARTK